MPKNINCIYNDMAWCKNKNVKRSLFGIGARVCVEYQRNAKKCEFKIEYLKPQNTNIVETKY